LPSRSVPVDGENGANYISNAAGSTGWQGPKHNEIYAGWREADDLHIFIDTKKLLERMEALSPAILFFDDQLQKG
jgi:hypothetical protein